VAECSCEILEFAQGYGSQMDGNHNAEICPQPLPHPQIVDGLMQKNRSIDNSLKRIKELLIAQNHAMEQQMKHTSRGDPGTFLGMDRYSEEKPGEHSTAASDSKKRRVISFCHIVIRFR
jgi:hypothetical protein